MPTQGGPQAAGWGQLSWPLDRETRAFLSGGVQAAVGHEASLPSPAADEGKRTDTRFTKARPALSLGPAGPLMFMLALLSEHQARSGLARRCLLLMAQVKLKGRVAGPHPRGEVSPDLPALLGSRSRGPGGWGLRGLWGARAETEIKSLADTSSSMKTVGRAGSRVQGRRVGTGPWRDARSALVQTRLPPLSSVCLWDPCGPLPEFS